MQRHAARRGSKRDVQDVESARRQKGGEAGKSFPGIWQWFYADHLLGTQTAGGPNCELSKIRSDVDDGREPSSGKQIRMFYRRCDALAQQRPSSSSAGKPKQFASSQGQEVGVWTASDTHGDDRMGNGPRFSCRRMQQLPLTGWIRNGGGLCQRRSRARSLVRRRSVATVCARCGTED